MPTLTMQVVCSICILIKVNTPLDECFDSFRSITHNLFHSQRVGNIITSDHSIVDVFFKIVNGKVRYRSYSSLRFSRIGFTQRSFANKGNLSFTTICHTQCITHSCYTAADNQKIKFVYHKMISSDIKKLIGTKVIKNTITLVRKRIYIYTCMRKVFLLLSNTSNFLSKSSISKTHSSPFQPF